MLAPRLGKTSEMIQRMSMLCAAALVALSLGQTAAAQTKGAISIELTPRMQDGKVARLDVHEVIAAPGLAAGQPLLKMPIVQTMAPTALNDPGSLTASDSAGPLPLEVRDDPVDPTQFKQDRVFVARRATVGDVTIDYPATPRVITAQTRPGPLWDMRTEGAGFYGQGGMILALPEEGWPRPVRLRWNLADMPKGSRGTTSTAEGPIDAVLTRDALARSFLMAGPFHSSPADGKGAFVAYWLTDPVFDMEAAVGWTRQAYAYYEKFWNQPNKPFRVFMRTTERFQGGGGGGFQSFIFGNTAGEDRDPLALRELMAHEASHNFVGNLGNSQGQWYSEGANVYYTAVLIHRAGLTTTDQYLATMNELVRLYLLNPRSNLSNAEATRLFFADGDAQVVPYQRGPLYFAQVDARLRAASGGKRRVDDLVKKALATKGAGRTDIAVWTGVVREALGQAGVGEFEAMMDGKPLYLPSDMLGPCFRRENAVYRKFNQGFRLQAGSDGAQFVQNLDPAGPAAQVGVRNGDQLLDAAPLKVAQAHPGQAVNLQFSRGGTIMALSFAPWSPEIPGYRWVRTNVPESACNI
jgi:hypothetical protein